MDENKVKVTIQKPDKMNLNCCMLVSKFKFWWHKCDHINWKFPNVV